MASHSTPRTFVSRGLTLAGTHTSPTDGGPTATALLLAGSGDLDRDGDQKRLAIGAQRLLAETLARAGWASFRYDKAGVAESEGDYLATSLLEERDDARAALALTVELAEGAPVIIVGHSAGALHALHLAAEPGVAGVALLSCAARPGEEVLRWQATQVEPSIPTLVRGLMRVFGQSITKQQNKAIARIRATTTPVARVGGARLNAAWMREFIDEDPRPALAAITIPVLAVTGTKDIQVDAADLDVIAATAPGPVTAVAADGVDHLLRDEPAEPRLQHYRDQVAKPLSSQVTAPLLVWIARLMADRPHD